MIGHAVGTANEARYQILFLINPGARHGSFQCGVIVVIKRFVTAGELLFPSRSACPAHAERASVRLQIWPWPFSSSPVCGSEEGVVASCYSFVIN